MLLALPFGIAIGLAFGMLGGGGSVLAVPLLVYVLGEDVQSATTASLVVVTVAALAGGLGQARGGQVCWRHALAFTLAAVPGLLAGTAAAEALSGDAVLGGFAVVMLAAAWATWRKASAGARGEQPRRMSHAPLPVMAAATRALHGPEAVAWPDGETQPPAYDHSYGESERARSQDRGRRRLGSTGDERRVTR